jgi:hypothetical protein
MEQSKSEIDTMYSKHAIACVSIPAGDLDVVVTPAFESLDRPVRQHDPRQHAIEQQKEKPMRVLHHLNEISLSSFQAYSNLTHATELLQLQDLHSAVADRPAQAPMRPEAHDSTRPVAMVGMLPSNGIDSRAPIFSANDEWAD